MTLLLKNVARPLCSSIAHTHPSRRHFLKIGSSGVLASLAVGGILLPVLPANAAPYKGVHTRIEPRGSMDTMDDYPYWIAREMGYFEELGVYTKLDAGNIDGITDIKALAGGQADMGFPAPGVLSFAIANQLDLVSVYGGASDSYSLAFRRGQGIKALKQLEGKTILLGAAAWQLIADPMFAAAGVDPKSIKYVEAGWPGWGRALQGGYGDAALTWEGQRAELETMGLQFDYWLGLRGSALPSHSMVVRRSDLQDQDRKSFLQKYLKAWAMGSEFADRNPRAAAQIVFKALPQTRQILGPRGGVESLLQIHFASKGIASKRSSWGEQDIAAWEKLFRTTKFLGQTIADIDARKIVLNDFIAQANAFSKPKVHADADNYALEPGFQAVDLVAAQKSIYANCVN